MNKKTLQIIFYSIALGSLDISEGHAEYTCSQFCTNLYSQIAAICRSLKAGGGYGHIQFSCEHLQDACTAHCQEQSTKSN